MRFLSPVMIATTYTVILLHCLTMTVFHQPESLLGEVNKGCGHQVSCKMYEVCGHVRAGDE